MYHQQHTLDASTPQETSEIYETFLSQLLLSCYECGFADPQI